MDGEGEPDEGGTGGSVGQPEAQPAGAASVGGLPAGPTPAEANLTGDSGRTDGGLPRADDGTTDMPVVARPPPRRRRRLVLGAATVLVAALGVGLALDLSGTAASLLVDGHGTATITWHGTTGSLQPLTASIDGLAVTGRTSLHVPRSAGNALNLEDWSFDVTGTAAGTAFSLVAHIYVDRSGSTPTGGFAVTGHFGTRAVTGSLTETDDNRPITLAGTVGAYRVTGQIGEPVRHGHDTTVTANFDVSGG